MQHRVWKKEYQKGESLIPSVKRSRPSTALLMLEEYTRTAGIQIQNPILDLGCGNGRHELYLAPKGYRIYALDFVESVVDGLRKRTRGMKNVTVFRHALPNRLRYRDGFFGTILDLATLISLNEKELRVMRAELERLLEPEGLFLTYCISDQNSYSSTLKTSAKQSIVELPTSGLKEKLWNPRALVNFYSNLRPLLVAVRPKYERIAGRTVPLEMIVGIFQKEKILKIPMSKSPSSVAEPLRRTGK